MTIDETALEQLKKSAQEQRLVLVAGTGSSLALTGGKVPSLSWKGLIANGFEYAETKAKITSGQRKAWDSQLNSSDIDEVLTAAEFMSRKLGAPKGDLYARWLESQFKNVTPNNTGMSNALEAIKAAKVPICTLNYDRLLEQATKLPAINMFETSRVDTSLFRSISPLLPQPRDILSATKRAIQY